MGMVGGGGGARKIWCGSHFFYCSALGMDHGKYTIKYTISSNCN